MPAVSGSPTQNASSVQTTTDLAGLPDDAFKSGDLAFVEALQPAGHFELIRSTGAAPPGAIPAFSGNGYWLQLPCSIVSVANIAELAAYPDAGLPNGAWAYVVTLRDYFQKIVQTPVVPLDGVVTVPTASGDGDWYRMGVASPTWASQLNWGVDTVNGDDENDGSVASPLATVAEFSRRLRYMKRGSTYQLNVSGNVSSTDALTMQVELMGSGTRPTLLMVGEKNVIDNGTLSAGNTSDPQANIALYPAGRQASITDVAGRTWTLGQIVYFTSGAANGAACFVTRNLGGGVARVSQPFLTTASYNLSTTLLASANSPTTNTTYDIVEYTPWNASVSVSGNFSLYWINIDFSLATASFDVVGCAILRFRECMFSRGFAVWGTAQEVDQVQATGCCIGKGISGSFTTLAGASDIQVFSISAFIYNRLSPRSRVVQFNGCTFQGDSDFSASPPVAGSFGSLDIGYDLSLVAPPGIASFVGINAFWDWGAGIGGGAITVMNSAVATMLPNLNAGVPTNFLMGSGGYRGMQALSGGQFLYPESGNASYVPRLIGTSLGPSPFAADVYLDDLIGGTDGAANAPIPALVPGAVVPTTQTTALTGGAGWAKWNTTFARRLLSHITRSGVYALR